ncbi:MAG: FtsX-like permease family protein [Candidatus Margulisbacteria bacterium]|nr:FtsX-like permease family protein [Candidatus Margulisiibacteriota bacterium]
MLLKLAFRNIFRNFRRTFFTFIAIAVGLALMLLADSMLSGIDAQSFAKIIDYETGHVKIFQRGYQQDKDNLPLDKLIAVPGKVINEVNRDPAVAGITSRVNFRIMLSDGVDQVPAIGIAVNPADDESVFRLKQGLAQGEFLISSEEAMLVGQKLADDFGVGVGDYLTVLARTKYDTYQALDLRIKGVLQTEDPQIDWYSVVIPLDVGQSSLDLNQGVTEIDIKLKDINEVDSFKKKIAKELPGLEIATWKEMAEDVLAISKAKYSGTFTVFFVIVLISLIGITNTILMAAFERVKEIGTMGAMGMRRGDIIKLFVLEGTMIGLLGSIVGCVLGAILVGFWMVPYGIDFTPYMRQMGPIGYRTTGHFYGQWHWIMFPVAFIFGIVVSALTSIYPAKVASRMEPSEALRK